MRWVILTDDYPPCVGGVATWTAGVAEGLRQARHDVVVFARQRPGLVGAHGVRGPSFGRLGGMWSAMAAARSIARADAVLATTWPVATGVARWAGSRLHVVGHGSDLTRPPIRPRARERVWRAAAHRWTVSEFLGQTLRAEGFSSRVLPAPVALRSPASPSRDLARAVLVARATPWKGGERFIRLVAALGVEGHIVGTGPELASWRAVAADCGAEVVFHGRLDPDATAAVVVGSDLAVLLPRTRPDGTGAEGLGLVLLEAAGVGVPAIGCATGGVAEAVGPGLVLSSPDDPDQSAREIRDWWSPERGMEAHAWVSEHHGVHRTVAALMATR